MNPLDKARLDERVQSDCWLRREAMPKAEQSQDGDGKPLGCFTAMLVCIFLTTLFYGGLWFCWQEIKHFIK